MKRSCSSSNSGQDINNHCEKMRRFQAPTINSEMFTEDDGKEDDDDETFDEECIDER